MESVHYFLSTLYFGVILCPLVSLGLLQVRKMLALETEAFKTIIFNMFLRGNMVPSPLSIFLK